MSLSAAVGAPAPVTIAGKTYTASPVDLFGLGELEEWARAGVLSVATKGLVGLPPDLQDRLFKLAMKEAMAVDFESIGFSKYLASQPGMATFLAISLRQRHPEMTRDAVARAVMGRAGEMIAPANTVLRISGLTAEDDQPGEGRRGVAELAQSSA